MAKTTRRGFFKTVAGLGGAISNLRPVKRAVGAWNRHEGRQEIARSRVISKSQGTGAYMAGKSLLCRGEAQRAEADANKYAKQPMLQQKAAARAQVYRSMQHSFEGLFREYDKALSKIKPSKDAARIELAERFTKRIEALEHTMHESLRKIETVV